MQSQTGYTLLFDEDCRICSAFARAARLFDPRGRLRISPIQESGDLLAMISPEARLDAAHIVAPNGRVTSGPEAMPALLAAFVAGPRFERRLRASRRSVATLGLVYGLMTELRGRLTCRAAVRVSAARIPR